MATRKKQKFGMAAAFKGTRGALLAKKFSPTKPPSGKKKPSRKGGKGMAKAIAGAKKMTAKRKPVVGGIAAAAGKGGAPPFPGAAIPFE